MCNNGKEKDPATSHQSHTEFLCGKQNLNYDRKTMQTPNVGPDQSVSYTHLDVYKRQVLCGL